MFERVGMPTLLYAKFIPGYSTVAPPLAGATGRSLGAFLLWDSFGSLLWLGSGVLLGGIFHRAIDRVVDYLETMGFWALVVLAVGLLLVIAAKWWQRRRFSRMLYLARISVEDLRRMMDAGEAPAIVDVRNHSAHLHDPRRIPGALRVTFDEIDEKLAGLPRDREVVLYCT